MCKFFFILFTVALLYPPDILPQMSVPHQIQKGCSSWNNLDQFKVEIQSFYSLPLHLGDLIDDVMHLRIRGYTLCNISIRCRASWKACKTSFKIMCFMLQGHFYASGRYLIYYILKIVFHELGLDMILFSCSCNQFI